MTPRANLWRRGSALCLALLTGAVQAQTYVQGDDLISGPAAREWQGQSSYFGEAVENPQTITEATAPTSAPTTTGAPMAGVEIAAIFDTPRLTDHDVLLLHSGDVLLGDLLDETLTLQTPYAHMTLPMARVAGVDCGDPEEDGPRRFEHIVAVNGDEFLGLGLEPELRFRLETGQEVVIPRVLVRRIVTRQRPGETDGLPRGQHVVLRGGDHFSGRLHHEGPVRVRAPYGLLSLDMAEVEAIVLPRLDAPGRVTMLTGTDITGNLEIERVLVTPDVLVGLGDVEPLDLSPQRLEVIYAQAGAIPDSDILERVRRSRLASLIEGSTEIRVDGTRIAEQITTETDTYHFRARAGRTYVMETHNVVNLDTYVQLLHHDAQTNLMQDDDGGNGLASRLTWSCAEDGVYYLQVWRLGMGPNQAQPGMYYNYPAGSYEVTVTEM